MFRVIGGAVVYGLALYGVVKIFERSKVAVVIHPNAKHGEKNVGEAASMGEGERDAEGQPAVGQTPTSARSVAGGALSRYPPPIVRVC